MLRKVNLNLLGKQEQEQLELRGQQMKEKNSARERKLVNMFVGPLGKAQIDALSFAQGIASIDAKMTIVEKMVGLNEVIDSESSTPTEVKVAEALLDELTACFLLLFEDYEYERTLH